MRLFSRALFGVLLVPACTISVVLPASADPASARTVIDGAPVWTSSAPVVADTPSDASQNLALVLNLRDPDGAEALAAAVSDPSSADYGKYVSASDWRARFAPTDDSVKLATDWLTAQGFSIGAIPANHRFVSFSGTAEQVESAFSTQLEIFDKDGAQASAPAAAVSVPTEIAGIVAAVKGLDRSATKTPLHLTGADDSTDATTSKSSVLSAEATPSAVPDDELPPPGAVFRNATPCSAYYGEKAAADVPQILPNPLTYVPCGYKPAQLRGAYGTDELLTEGLDGRGTTVAVVDAYASPTILADAKQYAANNDPRHPFRSYQFRQLLPASYSDADECGAAGWYGEETLDVEAVHAMAPAAKILYVGASSCNDPDILAAVNSVVDNSLAQVITNSYGDAGEDTAGYATEEHQTYLQAAAQGISMLFSSGDSGDEVASLGDRTVDSPASDPWVTAVGGTSLAVDQADSYVSEQGWGTGKSTLKDGAWSPVPPAYLYGGGGGTSKVFKQPDYQQGVVPDSIANYFGQGPYRAVPDVAMVGDPSTGFLVGQSQTFPDGSVQYSEYRIGGTSLASPLFAGVVAAADQYFGGSLGFLNYYLYALSGTGALRDVDHGSAVTDGVVREDFANAFDDADGILTSLRTLNQTGTISTRPGYDDVTGVGSPNLAGLVALVESSGHGSGGSGSAGAGGAGSSSGGHPGWKGPVR